MRSARRAPDFQIVSPSIDMYLTYRCNFRCRHCFLGDLLDTSQDLPWTDVRHLIENASTLWGTREISFLGGEPALYPMAAEAIGLALDRGYSVRLVTNGGKPTERLLTALGPDRAIHLAFSIDGSQARLHDNIRKKGSFTSAITTMAKAKLLGHSTSGIISIGRHNISDALATIEVIADYGLDYINVHFVTDRGTATRDMVASHASWLSFRKQVHKARPGVKVRFERTFVPNGNPMKCSVREHSMLMFFPDGRVFSCTMFIDSPNGHEYIWSAGRLELNREFNHRFGHSLENAEGCPAVNALRPELELEAKATGYKIGCIFEKELI